MLEVVGRACRLPGAPDVGAFWQLLANGKCTVSRVERGRFGQSWYEYPLRGEPGKTYTFAAGVIDDVWDFDPGAFGISPREARQMDPQQRLMLQLVWEALEDAGVPPSLLSRRNVGVYVGASSMDHGSRTYFDSAVTDSYMVTGNSLSLISNRVSYIYDLHGPSLTVDTACSSSLVGMDAAAKALATGEIDVAIVGGVNLLLAPFQFIGFSAASMLAPDGLCRAFDAEGSGYVRSEGGVVFVLQRDDGTGLPTSTKHGRLVGIGTNSDGRTVGIAFPSADLQGALLERLYATSGVDPNDLAFVEAHGTGTRAGDPVEARALGSKLGRARSLPLLIGSAKSNIGHLEPASGVVGMLKAMLALQHDQLPASLHFQTPNPDIPFDDLNLRVATSLTPLPRGPEPRYAGVNNFGFGGTNVHVILTDADHEAANGLTDRGIAQAITTGRKGKAGKSVQPDYLLLSAHTPRSLARLASAYAELLEHGTGDWREIARAVVHHRELMRERLWVSGDDAVTIASRLAAFARGESPPDTLAGRANAHGAKTAFVYSGNGSQWPGMGRTAFATNGAFKASFRRIDRRFMRLSGWSLKTALFADDLGERLRDTRVAQPLLFAVQVALTDSLRERGLKPAVVFGHSVGEVAAAHVAGILDLDQAVAVIHSRSVCLERVRGTGLMAAVARGESEVAAFLDEEGLDDVAIAAVNAPRSVTISGPTEQVRRFAAMAKRRNWAQMVLDLDYPFHSALVDEGRDLFLKSLPGFAPQGEAVPFISTNTGTPLTGASLDVGYWWRNVREPIRFADAVGAAIELGVQTFVEIGPRPILTGYIAETADHRGGNISVVKTLDRSDPEGVDPVRLGLGRAIVAGAEFEPASTFGPRPNRSLPLPAYPWDNQHLELTPSTESLEIVVPSFAQHPFLGHKLRQEELCWVAHVNTQIFPYLEDHKVDGSVILPGACFAEIALTAARQIFGCDQVEVRDLDLVGALELSDSHISEIRTVFSPDISTITISSRQRLSGDPWQVHARCRVARIPGGQVPVAVPPNLLPIGGPEEIERLYATAARFGLQFGSRFKRLVRCEEPESDVIVAELDRRDDLFASNGDFGPFGLHPLDLDGCFQALNRVYDRDEVKASGLPQIPVRIGRLRLFRASTPVRTCRVRVVGANGRGGRGHIEMFADDGELVAILDDFRLKAVALKRRHTLESAAYHVDHELIALPGDEHTSAAPALSDLLGHLDRTRQAAPTALEDGRLLVESAVCSLAYEAVRRFSDRDLFVSDQIDGALSSQLKNILSVLSRALEERGLLTQQDGAYRLAAECPLPSVDEIVAGLLATDPDWSSNCVLLARAASIIRQASDTADLADAITRSDADEPAIYERYTSSTLEHFFSSSPVALVHFKRVRDITEGLIESWPNGRPLRILQLGGESALTEGLLRLVADRHGRLVTACADKHWADRVKVRFDGRTGFHCIALGSEEDRLASLGPFDLLVSSNGLTLFSDIEQTLETVAPHLANGAVAIISANEPDVFHDVVFGLAADWFGQTLVSGFPIGQLRPSDDLAAALAAVGFVEITAEPLVEGFSSAVLVVGRKDNRPFDAVDLHSSWIANAAKTETPTERRMVCVVGDADGRDADFGVMLVDALSETWPELPVKLLGSIEMDGLAPTANSASGFGRAANGASLNGHSASANGRHPQTANREISNGHLSKANGYSVQAANGEISNGRLTKANGHGAQAASIKVLNGHSSHDDAAGVAGGTTSSEKGIHLDERYTDIVFVAGGLAGSVDPVSSISHQMMRLTRILRALGKRKSRLWCVAPGGARGQLGLGTTSPEATAIWSLARVAANEYGDLDIRLVGFSEDFSDPDAAAQLARLIRTPGALPEMVLTGSAIAALKYESGPPPISRSDDAFRGAHPVRLALSRQGSLDSLEWQSFERRPLAPHDVEIEVVATGLNFRDVMWALGLLPEEALSGGFSGPTLGFECSGHVSAVGEAVTDFKLGDPVMAVAPAAFASHVTVAARAITKVPAALSLCAAATIPVAFLTAYYALSHLAEIEPEEWVLIHGGAGGVGLAALQIAIERGARVIATAGTDEKRDFLRTLGADCVLDSRSLDFVDQVMEATHQGVDVVINALAGEAMERSIELLRPFGRFIELGKRDFYENTKVGLRPLRSNISYFAVDADQLLANKPELARRLLTEVMSQMGSGRLAPLPYRAFDADEVVAAFRLMQQSGHIGKIIVNSPRVSEREPTVQEAIAFDPKGYHVVVGGAGGFGVEVARWLADRGARHIVLTGRTGALSLEARSRLEEIALAGAVVDVAQCDVADAAALEHFLAGLRRTRPIRGVMHLAMVLDDCLIRDLTPDRIDTVLKPKVAGARNLDRLTRDDPLDYFMLFSSAAVMIGNPGQGSYAAANGYLEGLARRRRQSGLPALAIGWGAITDVGVLTRNEKAAKTIFHHTGGAEFTARQGLDLLEQLLRRGPLPADNCVVPLAEINWTAAREALPVTTSTLFASIGRGGVGVRGGTAVNLVGELVGLSEEEALRVLSSNLAQTVGGIFRMPADAVNTRRPLSEMGMDSLMGMELRMAAQQMLGIDIPIVSMAEGVSIHDIALRVLAKSRSDREPDGLASSDTTATNLIGAHTDDELDPEELAKLVDLVERDLPAVGLDG